MVAAVPLTTVSHTNQKNLTLNDLRNVAFGLAAAITLILVAGQIFDSGSASVSDSELTDHSAKRFVSISITTVATDNVVTTDEASAGFTVVGVTDETGETVTCNYGGVTDSVTAHASTGAFTCLFDDDGTGTYADMSGVTDGTITVYATVSATNSGNIFVTQDITDPTITITTTSANTPASGGTTNTAAIALTFTLSESSSDFAVADIAASGCSLGSLSGSGSSYSATCTASSSGAVTINVAANGFTDSVGNGNTVATQYAWTYDGTAPTVSSATMSDTTLIEGETATLTIVFSEAVAAFASNDDVDCDSGSLAVMTSGNSITWTGTFTPTAETSDTSNTCDIASSYTDTIGNSGGTGATANYIVDGVDPEINSVSFSDTAMITGDTPTLTIVFSEAVAAFASAADVTCATGSLAAMSSSD
ncbi:Ig-like domain-containing protein, partial [Candidatus Poseidoniales archaeon]|nr:Ig-like domain-containing protein [Candidatus Poseidoniales archaeon]